VPPVFLLGGWLGADHAKFVSEVLVSRHREPNFWDGALILPTNKYALAFAFILGFVLIVGDLYVRDVSNGTAPMTLYRSCSRDHWWIGKIGSLALPALLYSNLAYVFALVGSALVLPVSIGPSRAANVPWGVEVSLYPRFEWMPMPVFFLFVILYTAFALWAVGAIVLAASAFYPRMVTPIMAGLAWTGVASRIEEPFYFRNDPTMTLNPVYHVTYVTLFPVGGGFAVTPWLWANAVLGGAVFFAVLAGALWLRRTDL
jgi:ABC-type transport system involved in multi-copper enzyme maturation permease subunit